MPVTLAEMIRVADSYALGDPTQPRIASNESNEEYYPRDGSGSSRRNDYRGKRRYDRPDHRYGSQQVAAVNQDQPGAGSNQHRKTGGQWTPRNDGKKTWTPEQKKQWQEKKDRPRYTYESMLYQPCKFHTPNPNSPAGHTTRQCEWMCKIEQGGSGNA